MSAEALDLMQEGVLWKFSFNWFFLLEIDVSAIHLRLPRGVFPREVRPGVALVGLGMQRGEPGALGHLPGYVEVSWSLMVEADLSAPMTTPHFSVFSGRITSDCEGFLDHAHVVDKMPIYRASNLRATFDPESWEAHVEDDAGPLFSLKSTHELEPRFEHRDHWIQLRSEIDGQPWIQAMRWAGHVFEHQQGHRVGELFEHPFFDGIDVKGLGERCYLQHITRPGEHVEETFFRPQPRRR